MALPVPVPDFFAANSLLQCVLEVSLTGLQFLRPIYSADRKLIDFGYEYLNPAAQRMLRLPERPSGTLLQRFPTAEEAGIFAFYCRVYKTGQADRCELHYEADGLDNYYRVAAQRSGEMLVVSFTDTDDQQHSALVQSQLANQAREQAERERNLLNAVLTQAPVAIGLFQGDDQVVATANAQLCDMWGYEPAQVLGKPLLEGVPELRGQGFTELMADVARTGIPYVGRAVPARLLQHGQLETRYFNFVYQPLYDAAGEMLGVLDIATDITEQVLASQQVEHLNEELAAANEELLATNEELFANNAELARAQFLLQQLNQELEYRVQERTQALAAAKSAAEQQRQRLARFFSQAPTAICILDGPAMVFELVNDSFQRLFPRRQLLGLPLLTALPELADQLVWQTLNEVYETGETHEEIGIRVPIARHENELPTDFYFHYIQQARYNENGRIDGILVFAFDMTAQVLAQQQATVLQAEMLIVAQHQAQERESFFRIFEQTPAAICFVSGPEHRLTYINPAYQQFFPDRQLQGLTVAQVQPEAVEQGFLHLLDHVYQTGETYFGNETPVDINQPGGLAPQRTYFNFTYQPFRENGQIIGISIFAYDVTEQVLARQQRAEAQARLQLMFEQAPAAIAIFQATDYVIEVANPMMCSILGRTLDQLISRPLFEALPEARDQGFREILDEVVQRGEPFAAQEVMAMIERNGQLEQIYLNFAYQPLRDAVGRITNVAAVATEVTEQVAARQQVARTNDKLRLANDELDTANQQLQRINVDLDNFIYTASHDLKAPITNIDGLLTALQEQLPAAAHEAEPVQHLLDMMKGAVDRFQKTIGHLTDISKLQQANSQTPEAVDLAALVEDVRLDLAPELAAAKAQLRVDVAACPTISFAPKNLRSIVYNLLSNAIKYRAPDRPPHIVLRSSCLDSRNILQVQDNGLGLNKSQQGQLFTMFQRLHSHVEGSGVGLYMVKKIVENAGGSITVQSAPGVGSTFVVALPR